ncbi:hypothetical protein Hrd1104_03225 [Halorhabdus sp. CBA1104]|uniref:DUF7523 family protein n=1 Tax=Halorhabdus sp. CBA1104 TaxID=1380432 RepID=UPI0012B2D5A4|nr:hypothetical protein [Halorhabdus sp. CBA1104]QGN06403.1 hypothetical protein Hrd1104_03225 [Halorhabdus sp. CBA1104]
MTLAEQAREAVRARPFVHEALRAGVINYSAAARLLDVGEEDAVAAALRRYGEELADRDEPDRSARVTMHSGVGRVEDADDGLLMVGDATFASGEGSLTAVLVDGDVDPSLLTRVCARLVAEDVVVQAAGVADESLVVLVDRRDGPQVVQFLEALV